MACDPLYLWANCPANWDGYMKPFYMTQAVVFGIAVMFSGWILAREMQLYGTSQRLMILHYLTFLFLLMKIAVVIHSTILIDPNAFGFDGAVVHLLHYLPYGFAYVAAIALCMFWFDHYFFVRSDGAEPRWLRRLRHRLLAAVVLLNVVFLALSVVSHRTGSSSHGNAIASLCVWALWIVPIVVAMLLTVRRLLVKLDAVASLGKRRVRDRSYLSRITACVVAVCSIALLGIAAAIPVVASHVAILGSPRYPGPDPNSAPAPPPDTPVAFVLTQAIFRAALLASSVLCTRMLSWPPVLRAEEKWILAVKVRGVAGSSGAAATGASAAAAAAAAEEDHAALFGLADDVPGGRDPANVAVIMPDESFVENSTGALVSTPDRDRARSNAPATSAAARGEGAPPPLRQR